MFNMFLSCFGTMEFNDRATQSQTCLRHSVDATVCRLCVLAGEGMASKGPQGQLAMAKSLEMKELRVREGLIWTEWSTHVIKTTACQPCTHKLGQFWTTTVITKQLVEYFYVFQKR